MTLTFSETEAPTEEFDTVPPVIDIEYPCKKCGREAGPYGGRGPKPTYCRDCKPARKSAGPSMRVTGKSHELAAQATETLASINNAVAMLAGGTGFLETMKHMLEKNDDFRRMAYSALVTDPNLCRQILSVGEKSAKMSLGLAYFSYGMGTMSVMMSEYKERKEARRVEMEEAGV